MVIRVIAIALCVASTATVWAELPPDWQDLNADDFVTLVNDLVLEDLTEGEHTALVNHAWTHYLADQSTQASVSDAQLVNLVFVFADRLTDEQKESLRPVLINRLSETPIVQAADVVNLWGLSSREVLGKSLVIPPEIGAAWLRDWVLDSGGWTNIS